MRKLFLGVSAGLAALALSAPASAGVAYFQAQGTPQSMPSNSVVVANFDGINQGSFTAGGPGTFGITSANVSNPPGVAAPVRRPPGATGNFAYVAGSTTGPSGVYTINFAPAQVFTFIFGSLNGSNSLTLNFANNTHQTFTGGQLAGLPTAGQAAGQAGRFTFDAQGIGGALGSIVSAVFTSGVGAAFEFDSIATAAPEPAMWGMMILGFGLVGGTLRRSRPTRKLAVA